MARKLFLIQDSDRSMHVIADNWQHAIDRWVAQVVSEDDSLSAEDALEITPDCVALIATETTTFTDLLI